jgi:hypothetical protein
VALPGHFGNGAVVGPGVYRDGSTAEEAAEAFRGGGVPIRGV